MTQLACDIECMRQGVRLLAGMCLRWMMHAPTVFFRGWTSASIKRTHLNGFLLHRRMRRCGEPRTRRLQARSAR